ncbi:F-box protein CPR30-like [Tripterygium wilfordii]|uniref:F-box protein CPR30-like n=1 Tax=Tripterygium wilfordii TaxID=458696 RepID=A0A7J7DK26_TRIWF|nr:F-box protein CPR30-like [Tripterygium wilfordii]
MSDYLPHEIVADILLRLPIRTIGVCSCVCKLWRSIITSKAFITNHLAKTREKGGSRALLRRSGCADMEGRFSLHFDTGSFDKFLDLDFPHENFLGEFHVVGYCNGLLCLADYDRFLCSRTCNVSLCNPTVRKCISLPPFSISHDFYFESLSFGFDSVSNDYKVMTIWFHNEENEYHCHSNPVVGIYSLSSNSWRDISETALSFDVVGFRSDHVVDFRSDQIFLNGAVHWILICGDRGDEEFSEKIVRFDMSHEMFDKMCLPNSLDFMFTDKSLDLSIAVFGEKLSIVCLDLSTFDTDDAWSVWVMMEYGVSDSWTKQFRISLQALEMGMHLNQVLGVRENGELILLIQNTWQSQSQNRKLLLSYNPECQQVTDLNIHSLGNTLYLDSFLEILVLLDHVNKNSKEEDIQAKKKKRKTKRKRKSKSKSKEDNSSMMKESGTIIS